METGQRQEQRTATQRRRTELLEAAERVVLRDGPEASMNAIAAEAGITKPILYRHFGDKSGLYRALAKRHTDALLATLRTALDSPGDRRDRVEATLHAYLSAIETRPQVYRFLMHPAETRLGREGLRRRPALRPAAAPDGRGPGRGDSRAARPRPGHPAKWPGSGGTASSG